jgi:membrane-bound metal-dependent hydrolase YbcI (DUF457 family)
MSRSFKALVYYGLDNLTHSLFGATLARTPLARAGRGTMAALVLASNAPDVDIVATAGGAAKYLEWHRGMTHGPLGIVGLGVVSASLIWIGRRFYDRRWPPKSPAPDNATFGMLIAVSIVGVLLHVLMDLPTSYGTRLLSPFAWHWFAVDWMPIVDIYLLVVLVAGLLGKATPAQARVKAAFVLLLMATNYGVRGAAHHQALAVAPRLFGPTLPPPCDPPTSSTTLVDSWPPASPPSAPPPGKRCLVEMIALPSFTSPFSWRIIAQMSNAYEIHDINLLDRKFREPESGSDAPWRLTLRYPNVWTPAVVQAANTKLGQVFLGFARMPAARSAVDKDGTETVRWTDVRFAGGPIALDQPAPRALPFTATVRIAPDGTIIDQHLGVQR